jgi:hypothetical protein
MIDGLKDSPPKLQQAYLNIINMIFSCHEMVENHENSTENNKIVNKKYDNNRDNDNNSEYNYNDNVENDKILNKIKNMLQPIKMLPSLLKLIDQGGSSAVRAKAVLTAQILCKYTPNLVSNLGKE